MRHAVRGSIGIVLGMSLLTACATDPASPSLGSNASPTPVVTTRPTAPPDLAIRGADAPVNVPDPCALLTMDELTDILGARPAAAERSFDGNDDSWACAVVLDDRSGGIVVGLYVNAAYPGWVDDLIRSDGGTELVLGGLVGLEYVGGGVAFELGQDVVVLLHDVGGTLGPSEPLRTVAASMVARHAPPD